MIERAAHAPRTLHAQATHAARTHRRIELSLQSPILFPCHHVSHRISGPSPRDLTVHSAFAMPAVLPENRVGQN
jgi:hypothetical protein